MLAATVVMSTGSVFVAKCTNRRRLKARIVSVPTVIQYSPGGVIENPPHPCESQQQLRLWAGRLRPARRGGPEEGTASDSQTSANGSATTVTLDDPVNLIWEMSGWSSAAISGGWAPSPRRECHRVPTTLETTRRRLLADDSLSGES